MESTQIAKIRTLMYEELTPEFCELTKELCISRIKLTKELRETPDPDEINNWSAHISGDKLFNEARKKYPELGYTVVKQKIRGYKYSEIQTNSFRLYIKAIDPNYKVTDSPLTLRYTIEENSYPLFPEISNLSLLEQKIPLFILYEKNKKDETLKSLRIVGRVDGAWDEHLSLQIFPVQEFTSSNHSTNLIKENLPNAADTLEIKQDRKTQNERE